MLATLIQMLGGVTKYKQGTEGFFTKQVAFDSIYTFEETILLLRVLSALLRFADGSPCVRLSIINPNCAEVTLLSIRTHLLATVTCEGDHAHFAGSSGVSRIVVFAPFLIGVLLSVVVVSFVLMLGLPINALPITFIICGVMILLFTLPLILGLPKRDVVVSYLMQVLVHGSMALQQEAQPIFRGK